MATCVNCGKKTGMRNPPYYLILDKDVAICDECYRTLEHFHIKLATGDLEQFDADCKLVVEELKQHQFNEETTTMVISYLQKQRQKLALSDFERQKANINLDDMNHQLLTTGYNFEGYQIVEYLGVISGQSALGQGAFSGFSASAANLMGTESSYFGGRLMEAKESATRELVLSSVMKGGNAVIGIDFDYITINNLITVIANGTSVIIKKTNDK